MGCAMCARRSLDADCPRAQASLPYRNEFVVCLILEFCERSSSHRRGARSGEISSSDVIGLLSRH
jgi:hypothetical protein